MFEDIPRCLLKTVFPAAEETFLTQNNWLPIGVVTDDAVLIFPADNDGVSKVTVVNAGFGDQKICISKTSTYSKV